MTLILARMNLSNGQRPQLVKDLTKALSSSYQQEEDQSYLDWCGAKGEDSEGLLELKNCDKSECHQEKIKEWNKMLKENKE